MIRFKACWDKQVLIIIMSAISIANKKKMKEKTY